MIYDDRMPTDRGKAIIRVRAEQSELFMDAFYIYASAVLVSNSLPIDYWRGFVRDMVGLNKTESSKVECFYLAEQMEEFNNELLVDKSCSVTRMPLYGCRTYSDSEVSSMLIEFSYIKENSNDIFKDLELVGKGYMVKSLKFDASESNAIIANTIIPTPVVNDMLIGIYSILHTKYGMGHKEFISNINKSKLKLEYNDLELYTILREYRVSFADSLKWYLSSGDKTNITNKLICDGKYTIRHINSIMNMMMRGWK
jgi:hypothetical protein